jgi:diacylglycerol kinase (CTP)
MSAILLLSQNAYESRSLSWADTTASTIGRMWGYLTPPLPTTQLYIPLPYLRDFRLGFAKRKSTAGFIAAALTGLTVTTSFWGYFASLRNEPSSLVGGGWKLVGVGIISGIISGIVEAIGTSATFSI